MPTPKVATVESEDEFLDLFNHLCDRVLLTTPILARRSLLNFRGSDKAVLNNSIKIQDIFKIVKQRKLKFTLTVEYTDPVYMDQVEPPQEPVIEKSDMTKRLEQQRAEIPEELLPPKKVIVDEPPPKPFVPEDIPDFDL